MDAKGWGQIVTYLIKRVLFIGVVVLGASVIIFFLSHAIPADPARAAMGQEATEEQVQGYRKEMGLDQPLYVQFGVYMKHLVKGDLGRSVVSRRPVAEDIKEFMPATLELVIPSIIFSLFGVVLGVISAVKQGRMADHSSRLLALFGMSMPVFWLGLVMQLVFYRWLNILPVGGRLPITMSAPPLVTGSYVIDAVIAGNLKLAWVAAKHLLMPVITLSTLNLALMARMTRAVVLEVLRTDYVRTARSKGLAERTVIYRHALRNAMIPLVTVLGLRVGSALGGSVITETIFSWPGIGRYSVQALKFLDYPVVTGFTLVMCISYAVANLFVDMSYFYLDPRIKRS